MTKTEQKMTIIDQKWPKMTKKMTKIPSKFRKIVKQNQTLSKMVKNIGLNSPGTEIFPFSYFAFTLFKLIRLIEDIKSIYIIQKTRAHGLDFGF